MGEHMAQSTQLEQPAEKSPALNYALARMVERRLAEERATARRVPFPLAGEGAVFDFRPEDLREFEEQHGASWYGEVEARLLASSPATVIRCLELGLKRIGARGDLYPMPIDPNALSFALTEAGEPALDGITRTVFGKSRADLIAEIEARLTAEA